VFLYVRVFMYSFCVHISPRPSTVCMQCVYYATFLILLLGYREARNCLDHEIYRRSSVPNSYAVYSYPNFLVFISIMSVWKLMGSK